MKKNKIPIAIIAILVLTITNIYASSGSYFDVYLKNYCSKKVEVRIQADGSSSVSSYNASEKHSVPVKEGYKLYVDGKLVLEFKASDKGKEIVLCK